MGSIGVTGTILPSVLILNPGGTVPAGTVPSELVLISGDLAKYGRYLL